MAGFDLFSSAGLISARGYQEQAVDAVIAYLRANPDGNPIVCAATGTGKSIMIARLIERVKKANPTARIMVATHVAELLEQNSAKLATLMPEADIGFYSAQLGEKDFHNEIVFAGIQSIYKQKKLGSFNLLIVDEAHTIGRKEASMWGKLIALIKSQNPKLRIVGFSATPFRMDSGSLTSGEDALFDEIVYDYSLSRAIQDGYLCPLKAKYTTTEYNIEGVGKVAGEYNLKQLEEKTNVDDLTRSAVAEMIERGSGRKSWLIFCNGVAHSFSIRDELRRQGISCETVTGETPDYERADILARFKAGTLQAVTNNAVWTTGVDVPNVDLIGMLRHTMSGGLLLQMAGRGTRIMADVSDCITAKDRRDKIATSIKPDVMFLDFAGNIERHGFLDQITAKDKKKAGEGVAPMKGCPECFSICHAAATKCKDCGYEFPKNTESKVGELYEGALFGGAPEEKKVEAVEYYPWNLNKEGKIPCLLVKYLHPNDGQTREYICLQHTGFAKDKADAWWEKRDTIGSAIDGLSIQEIYDGGYTKYLMWPESIVVKKDGKFDRILSYGELQPPKKCNQDYSNDDSADLDDWEIRL